jgi:glycosyltransferase involved in cell wall biosynthesis
MNNCKSSSPLISVVVCTYNRATLLVGALQTLCGQTLDRSYYEVIVVDNNSTDETRSSAEEFCRKCQNVRYFLEMEQGLSNARNRGWMEARGEYVAYIDDDCIVPEHWLSIAKDIIVRLYPGVFGGPFYTFYNTTKPAWYKDAYGEHVPFDEEKNLNSKECPEIFGGNMFLRRRLIESFGGFDVRLGMQGDKIGYCEETALILNISNTKRDELIYYNPNLYVFHLVQKKKMNVRWLVRSWFVTGLYSIYCDDINSMKGQLQFNGQLKLLGRFVLQLGVIARDIVHGTFWRNRTEHICFRNYLYESTYRHIFKLGKLYGHISRIVRKH